MALNHRNIQYYIQQKGFYFCQIHYWYIVFKFLAFVSICGIKLWQDSWESLGLQGDPTSSSQRRSVLGVHWEDWCESWNSNTLATLCKELTHWKRPWCWEGLGAGGEGDDRGWDGWMASPAWWTWVSVNSGSWWWTGTLACCDSWGHKESDMTERLNWTELKMTS